MTIIYDITILATHSIRTKYRHCQGTYHQSGESFIFVLEQTKRWFELNYFDLQPGYLLIPEGSDCAYKITNVDFCEKRPKKAVLTAIPVEAKSLASCIAGFAS